MLKIDPKSLGAFEKRTPGPRYSGFLRNLPTNTTVLLRGSVKSGQLYLGRVAVSAIGWYQKGPWVNYDYTIKIKKLKITLKLCTRILKSE